MVNEWVSVREHRIYALKNLLRQFNKWNIFSGHALNRRTLTYSFAARVAHIFHLQTHAYISTYIAVCVRLLAFT